VTIKPLGFLKGAVVIWFLVPAYYVLPGAGAAGSLPSVLGLLALVWWLLSRFALGNRETTGYSPVRWALFAWLGVVMLSWINAKLRVLTPLEASESDRSLLQILGLAGIALVAMDGLRSRKDIDALARAITWASMTMVVVAVIQFFAGVDLAQSLKPPGLLDNFNEAELGTRSIFTRPRGTTMHAIELGVVSAALVPIAYWAHRTKRTWQTLIPLAGLTFAAMISLSRSAVLAMVTAVVVLILAVSWRERLNLLVGGAICVVAAGLVVDGLVGTIRSLFSQAENDPSIQARIDRFPRVMELVADHPWFGRGFGTFTIQDGFLLDNEVQGTLITMGLLGLACLILFLLFVVAAAWRTGRGKSPDERIAGAALAATILGLSISSYTFDAFYYQILTNLLYLCIGMAGALWRVTAESNAPARVQLAVVPSGIT
jgi:hypothetical protein